MPLLSRYAEAPSTISFRPELRSQSCHVASDVGTCCSLKWMSPLPLESSSDGHDPRLEKILLTWSRFPLLYLLFSQKNESPSEFYVYCIYACKWKWIIKRIISLKPLAWLHQFSTHCSKYEYLEGDTTLQNWESELMLSKWRDRKVIHAYWNIRKFEPKLI